MDDQRKENRKQAITLPQPSSQHVISQTTGTAAAPPERSPQQPMRSTKPNSSWKKSSADSDDPLNVLALAYFVNAHGHDSAESECRMIHPADSWGIPVRQFRRTILGPTDDLEFRRH
jgi:hypothetical protein